MTFGAFRLKWRGISNPDSLDDTSQSVRLAVRFGQFQNMSLISVILDVSQFAMLSIDVSCRQLANMEKDRVQYDMSNNGICRFSLLRF